MAEGTQVVTQTQQNSTNGSKKSQSNWATVKLPRSLKDKLKEMAKKENKAMWEVVGEGLECLQRDRTKNWARRATNDLDRTAYYIMKLMTAVERFKIAPSLENLEWIEKTVDQIHQRLGVDVGYVVNIAKRYKKTHSKDDYVELNMMAKMAIQDIILKTLLEVKS